MGSSCTISTLCLHALLTDRLCKISFYNEFSAYHGLGGGPCKALAKKMRKERRRIVHCHLLVVHGEAEEDAAEDVPAASNGCGSTSLHEHDCPDACDR